MTNPYSILKSRGITLLTKVCLVKAMVFPVVMYRCGSWTIKKAECQRIDVFELWCWRRLLRVPWTARRSNQSSLKEISPEYSLEGLMLKLQYFGHLMWRTNSLEKTLMLGMTEGRRKRLDDDRGWDGWKASLTRWTWVWASSRSCWWTGKPGVLQSMGLQRVRHDRVIELNWTDQSYKCNFFFPLHSSRALLAKMHQDICTGLLTVVFVGANNPAVGTSKMNSRIYMKCNIVNDKRMRKICMCCLEKTTLLSKRWRGREVCLYDDLCVLHLDTYSSYA